MTDTEAAISIILERVHGAKRERITAETLINTGFGGVGGDDAIDILNEVSRVFGIDVSDFDVPRYFGPESWGASIAEVFRGRGRKQALSVRELAEYVDRKKGAQQRAIQDARGR